MRKLIIFEHQGRRLGVVWLSFQPNGSISCGLRDRTFVSPRFKDRIGLWNAYNRITIKYDAPTDPRALVPVTNPHFTFHPPATFHLKGQLDLSSKNEDLFDGIADVQTVLHLERRMPWLRLVSKPLDEMNDSGPARRDGIETSDLAVSVPVLVWRASAVIDVDFIHLDDVLVNNATNQWDFRWHSVGLRVRASYASPQTSVLSWFHSY